ncbi:MAG: histidine triad nucleotide-binding protein [Candidatus Omnitrophota bacterium]
MDKLKQDCLFCDIIKKEAHSAVVYEDARTLAFKDIYPQAPVHIIIVPKIHIDKMIDVTEETVGYCADMLLRANELAKEFKIDQDGFRLVFNCDEYGGQTIYHIHMHLLGGRRMTWPPG